MDQRPATPLDPYDNNVTAAYKWANTLGVPARLLLIRPRTTTDAPTAPGIGDFIFESLPAFVTRLLDAGLSYKDISTQVGVLTQSIDNDDIAMAVRDYWRQRSQDDPSITSEIVVAETNIFYQKTDPKFATIEKFENTFDLDQFYDIWYDKIRVEQEETEQRVERIVEIHKQLHERDTPDKPQLTPIIVVATTFAYTPLFPDGRQPDVNDGLDILNNTIVSTYVPFIQYVNSNGEKFYKIFHGLRLDDEPNYAFVISSPGWNTVVPDTMYITMWLGDITSTRGISEATRESFYKVVYRLTTNQLTVEAPAEGNGYLVADERIRACLSFLNLGPSRDVKIRGNFEVVNFEFDDISIVDAILNETLISSYLYVEENARPFALKKRLDVHYRSLLVDEERNKMASGDPYISNFAAVSVTLGQRYPQQVEYRTITNPNTGAEEKVATSKYVRVTITQSESMASLEEFIRIFPVLLKRYSEIKEQTYNYYLAVIPEITELPQLSSTREEKGTQFESAISRKSRRVVPTTNGSDSRIRKLQSIAPDIFVDGYARKCQRPYQPDIVSDEEADVWRQRGHQVMRFPLNAPVQYNFVCPDPQIKYPGVKWNKDLSNRDQYKYIPCCFKRPKMGVPNSLYSQYEKGLEPNRRVGAKAENRIKTDKVLNPGGMGFLPYAVENILKKYNTPSDMVRYGVNYSPNAFLHCVSVATADSQYGVLRTDGEREQYVMAVRTHLANITNPYLLKQELYDRSPEEITAMLADTNLFFDPNLFFRAVEEAYGINIYVFSPSTSTQEVGALGVMDVPRFRDFHVHNLYEQRPTVLIIRHLGAESDALTYPHCEVIADHNAQNQSLITLFGASMTNLCYSTLREVIKSTSVEIRPGGYEIINHNAVNIDYSSILPSPPIAQFVDEYGKMRAVTMNLGTELVTVIVPPAVPLNLPHVADVARANAATVVRTLGQPFAAGYKEVLDGLWFNLSLGEYVPVSGDTSQFASLPTKNPLTIIPTGRQITGRLSTLRRVANIIVQLVRWLYDVARLAEPITVADFFSNYVGSYGLDNVDSSTIYDLSNVPRRLPFVANVVEAIGIMSQLAPTLFNNGRVIMYNNLFLSLMYRMLLEYSKRELGHVVNPRRFITNYYTHESDFKQQRGVRVIIGEKDFDIWLASIGGKRRKRLSYTPIHHHLDASLITGVQPILYSADRLYIIQPVVGGSLQAALYVALMWTQRGINVGYNSKQVREIPVHIVYALSRSLTPVPVSDQRFGSETFLSILYVGFSEEYNAKGGRGIYAAILPL